MSNIQNFNGRQFKNAESSNADLLKEISEDEKEEKEGDSDYEDESSSGKKLSKLSEDEVKTLGAWMTLTFPNRLLEVKPTNRLADFPAVITDHESSAVLKMMRALEHSSGAP